MSKEVKILFRYNDKVFFEERVDILLSEYLVTKETECGWWVGSNDWLKHEGHFFYTYSRKRWISKTTRKKFAYPTKEEALTSFKARKQMQIRIVEDQLERAKKALLIVENIDWLKKNNHDHP